MPMHAPLAAACRVLYGQQAPFLVFFISGACHLPFSIMCSLFLGVSEEDRNFWRQLDVLFIFSSSGAAAADACARYAHLDAEHLTQTCTQCCAARPLAGACWARGRGRCTWQPCCWTTPTASPPPWCSAASRTSPGASLSGT
jgi:hypothetical protein